MNVKAYELSEITRYGIAFASKFKDLPEQYTITQKMVDQVRYDLDVSFLP